MERFENASAAQVINRTLAESKPRDAKDFTEDLDDAARGSACAQDIRRYSARVREALKESDIAELEDGVGGQYDGSKVEIAAKTLEVDGGGVEQTIARVEEVARHEAYHALHRHTAAMAMAGSEVVIAGEEFATSEIVEGLTVAETGDRFVSDGYKTHKSKLLSALERADLTLSDARGAVNEKKDLSRLDDRGRDQADAPALTA